MPAFAYHALDADGRTRKGVLQADTARAARASLRERGLNALDVSPVSDAAAMGEGDRGLSAAQLALLTRQLSALIGSGLPIDEALGALAEGSEGRLRSRLVSLRARVMEGVTLANAMAESPNTFPVLYRATIAAGEASDIQVPHANLNRLEAAAGDEGARFDHNGEYNVIFTTSCRAHRLQEA